jgi:hypothetical protein
MQLSHCGALTMFLNSMIFSIPYLNQGPFINIIHISIDIPFGFLPGPQVSTPSTTRGKKVVICSFSLEIFQPEKFNFNGHTHDFYEKKLIVFWKRERKSHHCSQFQQLSVKRAKMKMKLLKHMSSDFIFSHGNFLQSFYLKKIWFYDLKIRNFNENKVPNS